MHLWCCSEYQHSCDSSWCHNNACSCGTAVFYTAKKRNGPQNQSRRNDAAPNHWTPWYANFILYLERMEEKITLNHRLRFIGKQANSYPFIINISDKHTKNKLKIYRISSYTYWLAVVHWLSDQNFQNSLKLQLKSHQLPTIHILEVRVHSFLPSSGK